MNKFLKFSQVCVLGLAVLATGCGGRGGKKGAVAPQGDKSLTSPPGLANGSKPLEAIPHYLNYLKLPLLNEELRKYCYFIHVSMIKDPEEKADKRQYTKPLHMNAERQKLIDAHLQVYKLLCNGPTHFVGFTVSNHAEKIVIDILTVRHLWALLASQDNTPNIKHVASTFKGSFSAWEKAFGSPEVRLWKDFYYKHSSMKEDAYQLRVKELSEWSKKEVQSTFNSFL